MQNATTETDLPSAILAAINNNDAHALLELSSDRLIVIEQSWESAADGYGFSLGNKTTTIYQPNDADRLKAQLAAITIASERALDENFSTESFREEFKGDLEHWKGLSLVTYLRGQGDVEHLVIVGIEPKTQKINTLYIN